jgi:hypothetical protein
MADTKKWTCEKESAKMTEVTKARTFQVQVDWTKDGGFIIWDGPMMRRCYGRFDSEKAARAECDRLNQEESSMVVAS